jgi:hypothetical protein
MERPETPEAIGLDDVGPRKINNKPSILMTRRSSLGERLLPMDQGEVDRDQGVKERRFRIGGRERECSEGWS